MDFDPLDPTKLWDHEQFPFLPVGKMVLNKNPENYFAEVEQAAFGTSVLVNGLDFSDDKLLQGRTFSYRRVSEGLAQATVDIAHLGSTSTRAGAQAAQNSALRTDGY